MKWTRNGGWEFALRRAKGISLTIICSWGGALRMVLKPQIISMAKISISPQLIFDEKSSSAARNFESDCERRLAAASKLQNECESCLAAWLFFMSRYRKSTRRNKVFASTQRKMSFRPVMAFTSCSKLNPSLSGSSKYVTNFILF